MNETTSLSDREAQLLSARFSCGVGWLINALLEMDVPVSVVREGWPLPTWTAGEGGFRISEPAHETLQKIFPALQRRRTFAFPPGLEVLSEHYIHPFARHPDRPTVLYVRDPRDAIYSWYRRFHRDEMTLAEYLCKPSVYHEGDGEVSWLTMPPAHTWAVYNLFWLAMADCMNVLVIRYEDMKTDTEGETKRVLEHLGLRRDDAQIRQALELSSFQRTKAVIEAIEGDTAHKEAYTAKGQAGEWRETYTAAELAWFDGPATLVMQILGYEPTQPTLPISVTDLTFKALLDAATPAAQSVLQRALSDVQAGNPEAARRRLAEAIAGDFTRPAQDGALVAALTALHWTRAIFTDTGMTAPTAQRTWGLFGSLNLLFRDDPHFQILQMEELVRGCPTLSAAYDRWASALCQRGVPTEAMHVLERACAQGAESALLRSDLATLYWKAGRSGDALTQILRATRLDRTHPAVRDNFAAILEALTGIYETLGIVEAAQAA